MATQIKKIVSGPFTPNAEGPAGVSFVGPDGKAVAQVLIDDLPKDIVTRLALHGLSQKVGDSYAGAGAESDPLAYAVASIKDTVKQLLDGDWRVTVAGGPRATLLARALARVTGKDLDECIDAVEGLEKEQKAQLRKDDRIKAASAEIKVEDAQKAKERASATTGTKADLGSLFSA